MRLARRRPIRSWRQRHYADEAPSSWATTMLAQHVQVDGQCARCIEEYGSDAAWPCLPALTAQIYLGETEHIDETAQGASHTT